MVIVLRDLTFAIEEAEIGADIPDPYWCDTYNASQSVTWDAPYDDKSGEPNGGFYVAEHESISRATLRILDRNGANFCIEWDGVCNVYWDETYGENVPFSIRAIARFTGVTVRGNEHDNADSLRDRLALYLDPEDFVQHDFCNDGHQYESGVGMAHCTFTPTL